MLLYHTLLLPPDGLYMPSRCPRENETKEFHNELECREGEKVGLKFNLQKTNIVASSPITSWQIDGETMETMIDFIFLGSKITADGDCRHKIKKTLTP